MVENSSFINEKTELSDLTVSLTVSESASQNFETESLGFVSNIAESTVSQTQTDALTQKTEPSTQKAEPIISKTEPVTQKTEPYESKAEAQTPIADDDWALYVIGNNNPLPENYVPKTKAVAGERTLDARCADYAIQMLKDAQKQGIGLYVTSSYRSVASQKANLENYIVTLMNRGYSKDDAVIQAHKEIALPGCSEHNAGLAMDIVSNDYWSYHNDLDESFEKLPQFDWLIKNSWKYGFILSYPKGKEKITGFIYEPWHYRFVGLVHAERIYKIYQQTGEFLTVNEYISNEN